MAERGGIGCKPRVLRLVGLAVSRTTAGYGALDLCRRRADCQVGESELAQGSAGRDAGAQPGHSVLFQVLQLLCAGVCEFALAVRSSDAGAYAQDSASGGDQFLYFYGA